MGLLDKLTNSILGLKGEKPQTFGVDPTPPASLHLSYSTDGKPNVTWRTISGGGPKPQPSRLDINDSKSAYTPTYKYSDHKPK
jgi:hypothetical protein